MKVKVYSMYIKCQVVENMLKKQNMFVELKPRK